MNPHAVFITLAIFCGAAKAQFAGLPDDPLFYALMLGSRTASCERAEYIPRGSTQSYFESLRQRLSRDLSEAQTQDMQHFALASASTNAYKPDEAGCKGMVSRQHQSVCGIARAIAERNSKKSVTDSQLSRLRFGKVAEPCLGFFVQTRSSWEVCQEGAIPVAIVSSVMESSAAATNGLRPGDVLKSVHGQSVEHTHQFEAIVSSLEVGSLVTVQVERADKSVTTSLVVGRLSVDHEPLRCAVP